MSFSWPTPSSQPFTSVKPASTNSFADALKRLAEHVEEKNKNIDVNHSGIPNAIQSSTDFPNRMIPHNVNNTMSPEQTLRLYTQYIQEFEKREDMRRRYLRAYGSNMNFLAMNRRHEITDNYRFVTPSLSNIMHPPTTYLPPMMPPQTRLLQSSPICMSNVKATDSSQRSGIQENTEKNSSEQSLTTSKSQLKLFRPYDLDSPKSNSHRASPSSPSATKKSSPSLSNSGSSALSDESNTVLSFGKEKQLFNSLGLVQQLSDTTSEKSPLVETTIPSAKLPEASCSAESLFTRQNNQTDTMSAETKKSFMSAAFKRKSVFSSNLPNSSSRKYSKIDKIQNTVE